MNAADDLAQESASTVTGDVPSATVAALGTIESSVLGRTRMRLRPELRTPETMEAIRSQLADHEHVDNVTINPRTGSVVVTHAKHRTGEAIFSEAVQEAEFLASAVLDLPEDEDESGGGRFGKLDQQLADLVYTVDRTVYRKTGLRFRGQILAGSVAGLGVAQIAIFGISLEMLPGPLLLWIAWDIYHRVAQEPPIPDRATALATSPDGTPTDVSPEQSAAA